MRAVTAFLCGIAISFGVAYKLVANSDETCKLKVEQVESNYIIASILVAEEAKLIQESFSEKYEKAVSDAKKREASLQADVSKSRTQLDSLRQQTKAAVSRITSVEAPEASRVEYAFTVTELFLSCVREYEALAGYADRHVEDLRMMQSLWPTLPE